MPLVQFTGVCLAYGHVPLLDHVDLVIESGRRMGLIGRNGTGKSSLLRIIEGLRAADDGVVWRAPSLNLASVPQEPLFATGLSIFDAVAEGLGASHDLLVKYHAATHALAAHPEDPQLLTSMQRLQGELDAADGWTLTHRIEATLSRFELDADRPVDELSGGLRKRVALARALVADPDLLLLDEPTNHLDVAAIEWLEETLKNFQGGVLLVTHDRRFLDAVANEILELDRGHLYSYPGNFAQWRVRKAEAIAAEAVAERKFDKFLAQEEVWIRKGVEARRTRNEGRVLRLEALRRERAARRERAGRVDLAVAEGERSGRLVAELEGVSKSFGEKRVVSDFSCRIQRGDKVGLIGPNGSGKTTLLKLIMGELTPDIGRARMGTKLEIAYFDQFRAALNEEATLADTISQGGDYVEINGARKHIMSYLGDFLFAPERVRALVKSLSGGERNRLLLARLFSRPANVLVLDEPTNDLDIETLELLEELLQDYTGTVFLVSHDREFLDNVVTQSIAFEGEGRWKEYAGGYADWVRARSNISRDKAKLPAHREKSRDISSLDDGAPSDASQITVTSKRKLSYKETRELGELPGRIHALETEQARIVELLANGAIYLDDPQRAHELNLRQGAIEAELDGALKRLVELEP